jgi:hypothetical protein
MYTSFTSAADRSITGGELIHRHSPVLQYAEPPPVQIMEFAPTAAQVSLLLAARITAPSAPRGYRQVDTSLCKDFHVWREQLVGFRADFLNIFNIASYGIPDNGITDGSFGLINNVRSPPRQIQLSLHYIF